MAVAIHRLLTPLLEALTAVLAASQRRQQLMLVPVPCRVGRTNMRRRAQSCE
jgi:hypothetical protein